jgi:FHA domain
MKCPFCGFSNEEGAMFCEQCKSDMSTAAPPSPADPTPMPESLPAADLIPMAQIEEVPMVAIVEEVAAVDTTPAPADVLEVLEVVEPTPVVPLAPQADPEPVVEAPPPPAAAAPAPPAAASAPPPPAPPPPAPAARAPAATAAPVPIPAGAEPKLVVVRGLKVNDEYKLFPGDTYIGRNDEKPVDVDLTFQEPEDKVWVSRQHALITFDSDTGVITIEDLNSANGTYVNREKIYPGQPKQIGVGSTVQIGTVHMRIKV